MSSEVTSVFVYGTLQRGEERERCWPHSPRCVLTAEVTAALYDLGDYPAIVPGEDRVAGELWQLAIEHLPDTLRILDEIEWYGQGDDDLYFRQLTTCRTSSGETTAYTYFLADTTKLRHTQRVLPGQDSICRWHRYR